jgi:hypothetical protein
MIEDVPHPMSTILHIDRGYPTDSKIRKFPNDNLNSDVKMGDLRWLPFEVPQLARSWGFQLAARTV